MGNTLVIVLTGFAIIGTLLLSIMLTHWKSVRLEKKVEEVHQIMNSRLDSLLVLAKSHARAEGVIEGRAQKDSVATTESKEVKAKLDEFNKLATSMKDQLVLKTEQEALARGGTQERARSDLAAKDARDMDAKQEIVMRSLEIKKDIAEVPDKTADKVVDKIKDNPVD